MLIEYLGIAVVFVMALISSVAGVGGGGSTMPFFIFFFAFDIYAVVAQSNSANFFATFSRFIF